MIAPSPTSKIAPTLARGVSGGPVPATTTRPACIAFLVPNSRYELHLVPAGAIGVEPGKRLVGTIRATAMRIDEVHSGGRYVEPLAGRPRRVQGRVVGVEGGCVVIDAGVPIHCEPTDPRRPASSFEPGQLVSCDVKDGATFAALA